MATIDILQTVCLRFIDCCSVDELTETWNSEGWGMISLTFSGSPTRDEFAEEVLKALPQLESGKLFVGPIEDAVRSLALDWWDQHNTNFKDLLKVAKPWWFGVGTSWRLQNTPFMYPKPKPAKDKRSRLHVQFN